MNVSICPSVGFTRTKGARLSRAYVSKLVNQHVTKKTFKSAYIHMSVDRNVDTSDDGTLVISLSVTE